MSAQLSIIIPTYNSTRTLARALNSIIAQSFADFEVLIMDGASVDDTIKVAESYGDNRIRIFSEPDNGIYDAMNKGIIKARGEWLYFLGSDDWLLNNHVFCDVFSQDIESLDVVYGEAEFSHLSDAFRGEWTQKNIFANRCHQAIIYKKSFLIAVGGYNLRFKIYADFDLNLKWIFNKKVKSKYIGVVLAHFSSCGISDSHGDPVFESEKEKLYLRNGHWFLSNYQKARCAMAAKKKSSGAEKMWYIFLSVIYRSKILLLRQR